eukprot:UN19563
MFTQFPKKVHTSISKWKGKLKDYKQIDGHWTFNLTDVYLQTNASPVSETVYANELTIKAYKVKNIPKPNVIRRVKRIT